MELVADAGTAATTSPPSGSARRVRRRQQVDGDVLPAPGLARRAAARPGGQPGRTCRWSSTTTRNCAARAESRLRRRRRRIDFVVCVTLGTGIGGAVVLGRPGLPRRQRHGRRVRPHAGRRRTATAASAATAAAGSSTRRATRWCGEARELVVQGSPVAHRLSELCGGDPTQAHRADGHRGGPRTATRCRSSSSPTWATGSASGWPAWRRRSTPSCIVVGGGVSDCRRPAPRADAAGHGPVTDRPRVPPGPSVLAAALGPSAGFIGAADMARSAARRSRRVDRRRDRMARSAERAGSAVPSRSRA